MTPILAFVNILVLVVIIITLIEWTWKKKQKRNYIKNERPNLTIMEDFENSTGKILGFEKIKNSNSYKLEYFNYKKNKEVIDIISEEDNYDLFVEIDEVHKNYLNQKREQKKIEKEKRLKENENKQK